MKGSWILLRGLARDKRHWGDFPEKMKEASKSTKILCIDLPGNGEFRHLKSPLRIEQMTDFVRRQTKGAMPVQVLAMSMGGMVAIDWATRFPKEILNLVLLAPSASGICPWYERLGPSTLFKLLKLGTRYPSWKREKEILKVISAIHFNDPEKISEWEEIAKSGITSQSNFVRQLLAASRFRLHKKPDSIQGIILYGGKDQFVHPHCTEALAQNLQIPVRLHPQAGHDLCLDDPEWVLNQIFAQ